MGMIKKANNKKKPNRPMRKAKNPRKRARVKRIKNSKLIAKAHLHQSRKRASIHFLKHFLMTSPLGWNIQTQQRNGTNHFSTLKMEKKCN